MNTLKMIGLTGFTTLALAAFGTSAIAADARISVLDIEDAGEEVVAVVRFSGRTRESDVPYDHTWGYVCRITDGRLTHFRAFVEPDEARAAAGLT